MTLLSLFKIAAIPLGKTLPNNAYLTMLKIIMGVLKRQGEANYKAEDMLL
jgi:hypothetical protein